PTNDGTDSFFNTNGVSGANCSPAMSVCAKGGIHGINGGGGAGGTTTSSVGSIKFNGGNGASGNDTGDGGGGAGGAAGPYGDGKAGGIADASSFAGGGGG